MQVLDVGYLTGLVGPFDDVVRSLWFTSFPRADVVGMKHESGLVPG